MLQLKDEIAEEDCNEPDKQEASTEEHGLMQLSLQALHGSAGFRAMRMIGMHGRRQLYILIDSGSTYNFLSMQTTHKLGCSVWQVDGVKGDSS